MGIQPKWNAKFQAMTGYQFQDVAEQVEMLLQKYQEFFGQDCLQLDSDVKKAYLTKGNDRRNQSPKGFLHHV